VKEEDIEIVHDLTDHDPEDGFVVTVAALEQGYNARDVRRSRSALNESKEAFGARFDVSPETVFEWELNWAAAPDPVVEFARSVLSHSRSMSTTDAGTVKESAERTVTAS